MTIIITGNFQQSTEARQVLSELEGSGFSVDQTTTFLVHPTETAALEQNSVVPARPTVEDGHTAQEPDRAGAGAVSGSVVGSAIGIVAGVATIPLLGPGAALAGTAIGAYVGSLYGALSSLEDRRDTQAESTLEDSDHRRLARKPGMLVAVLANVSTEQDLAIRILRNHGATDIERLEGVISAGEWTDFNPRRPLKLLADTLRFRA